MTTIPQIQIVDEALPVATTGDALVHLCEALSEGHAPMTTDINILVLGHDRGVYATVRHPAITEANELDPQWMPIIVEQLAMDLTVTGFVMAFEIPLIPGARCSMGLGYEASGQSWVFSCINGFPMPLPAFSERMTQDGEAIAKRLWGQAWESACLHDHDHG